MSSIFQNMNQKVQSLFNYVLRFAHILQIFFRSQGESYNDDKVEVSLIFL